MRRSWWVTCVVATAVLAGGCGAGSTPGGAAFVIPASQTTAGQVLGVESGQRLGIEVPQAGSSGTVTSSIGDSSILSAAGSLHDSGDVTLLFAAHDPSGGTTTLDVYARSCGSCTAKTVASLQINVQPGAG